MSNTTSRKLLSLILAVLMAMSTFASAVFADTTDGADSENPAAGSGSDTLQDITELLSTLKYAEYIAQYPDKLTAKPDGFKVEFSEDTISADEGTEYILIESDDSRYADLKGSDEKVKPDGSILALGDAGKVTFNINVPETGLYSLKMEYRPVSPAELKEYFPVDEGEIYLTTDSTASIERTLYVNDKVPYSEARFVKMDKSWSYGYAESGRFTEDQGGNELRPSRSVNYIWQEYTFTDSEGYFLTPLQIYLEEGENTIALEAVREAVFLADVEFFKYEEPKKYEDVLAEYERNGYKYFEGEPFEIQAELPYAVSSGSIIPTSDPVSPSTYPQSAKASKRNVISSSEVGEWIEYEIDFPESAIYTFVIRYRQDASSNPTSRKILIDGELPYDKAQYSQFEFGDNWQTTALTADGEEVLKFYITAGKHRVRFEANLGEIGEMLRRVSAVQSALNADYLEIVRLTGAEPDEYRDYGFARVVPHVMRDFVEQGKELEAILEYLETHGELSESTSTLTQIADRVLKMGTDEDQIAKNLDALKSDLSALGSWVSGMQSQYLEMDYILVTSPDGGVPKAEGNFFESSWYEVKKFFYSFVIDYNALAVNEDGEVTGERVEVWSQSSRDQVQIIKDLTDSKFTPEAGIPVTVKLVAGGTLLPSVLAGIGPDVALDGTTSTSNAITAQAAGSIIDYAVRGAILPVEGLEGFDEVYDSIYASAFEVVTLDDPEGKVHVYGVPVALEWNMMFYRKDILGSLGIGIPETWDDVLAGVPVLQFNNMEIGLTRDVTAYATMIYQSNGAFWADNGMRVNFDSNSSLEAFEYLVNMFTQYSLPLNYDAVNRFRSGELPLFLGTYTTYNTVTLFATELAGLWGFDAIPGKRQDDGTVNRSIVGNADAITMLRGCEVIDEAWEFMKWFSAAEFQAEYSNELVNLLGEAGMRTVASKGALTQLQWKKDDRNALIDQAKAVICLRQYPGSYFITRYVDFAVNNAYNEGADPVEQLLGYITAINKEISRKRSEFGYETLEVGQTLAEKRFAQAEEAIGKLSESDAATYENVLNEVRDAIKKSVDADAAEAAANALESANGELFAEIAGYLKDAAAALRSYK